MLLWHNGEQDWQWTPQLMQAWMAFADHRDQIDNCGQATGPLPMSQGIAHQQHPMDGLLPSHLLPLQPRAQQHPADSSKLHQLLLPISTRSSSSSLMIFFSYESQVETIAMLPGQTYFEASEA